MAAGSSWGWVAGGAAVVGLIWLASGKKSASSSKSPRSGEALTPSPIALPSNVSPTEYYSKTVAGTGVKLGLGNKGSPYIQDSLETQPWEVEYAEKHYDHTPPWVRGIADQQAKLFAARYAAGFKAHPTDWSAAPDKHSKQLSLVYRPEHALHYQIKLMVPVANGNPKLIERQFSYSPWGWYLTDEYGRPAEGWGAGGFDVLATISMVGNTVLPYIPGYGQAANVALQATIALAQGKSMEEVAFAAVRAALPPGAAYAFDLGVGVILEGKPVDQALINAALTELDKNYPGAKAAYEQGQAMAKQYTGQNINVPNVNGFVFGGVL